MRRRAGDAVAGQVLGNGVEAVTGEELGEDPLDHGGSWLIDAEGAQPLAVCGLGGVGVRAHSARYLAGFRQHPHAARCWCERL
jgi:hypothetical protein